MSEKIPTPWLKTLEGVRRTSVNYEEMTTYDFMEKEAINNPNDLCMIFGVKGGKSITRNQTLIEVKKLALKLKELGIKKGDRVLLLLPNTPHYVISHYAVLAIGAIIVQGNPIYSIPELTYQANNSGARVIITLSLFQEKANTVMKNTSLEFTIIANIADYMSPVIALIGKLTKKLDDPKFIKLPNNYLYKSLLAKADISKFKKEPVKLDDVAMLQYTGGTTGAAKGATLTHRNISCNAQQAKYLIEKIPEKMGSVLTILPLFHSFGLTCCLGISFQKSVPMVMMPRFNAKEALENVEKYNVSFVPGVPTMMIALMNHPDFTKRDLTSVIASISGGAPLPVEVAQKYISTSGTDVVEGYGLSETSPIVTGNPVKLDLKARIGSIGLPAPDTFIKIVDTDDYSKTLGIGEVGEVCIKGPQVMKGYWNNEEDTKKVLTSDGWFLSGDIGKMDEDGFFYIVDRKKDLIIVSGNNVVPREVEEVLYSHPAVLEAAVAGLPHETKGEMVVAWIVLKEGQKASEEDIVNFCKEKLAPYKLPKQIHFRDELPKSMIGKILRRKLKEEELNKS